MSVRISGKTRKFSTGDGMLHDRISDRLCLRSDLGYRSWRPQSSTLEGNGEHQFRPRRPRFGKGDLAKRHLEAVAAAVPEIDGYSVRSTRKPYIQAPGAAFRAWAHGGGSHVASPPTRSTDRPPIWFTVDAAEELPKSFHSVFAMESQGDSASSHRRAGLPTPTVSDSRQDDPGHLSQEPLRRQTAEGHTSRGMARGLREASGSQAISQISVFSAMPRVVHGQRPRTPPSSPGRALCAGKRSDIAIVLRHERRTAATRRSRQPALGRREVPAGRELPSDHPVLKDIQHARGPVRGCSGDRSAEPHPPEEAVSESPGVWCSARQDHLCPDCRDVHGSGTR